MEEIKEKEPRKTVDRWRLLTTITIAVLAFNQMVMSFQCNRRYQDLLQIAVTTWECQKTQIESYRETTDFLETVHRDFQILFEALDLPKQEQ